MGYVNLVFFMIYPFLFQLVFSSSTPHLCPKNQALSLLQFKHMFTIDPNVSDYCIGIRGQSIQSYPKTLSWNKSTDCCSWDGVHCDEMTGQVIELNLTCSKLQGKFHFNSSLFQLSNLKRLDLSYNDFSGSLISPKFGEFSSLTHLDLLLTSFTGLIPAEISHLSKLRVLRIRSDYGVRFRPNNFELFLKNLTQLRELDLNFVNISSTFPLNFSSYLTTLWLPYTQLRGILPKRVFHLSNLESLDLTNNPQLTVRFPTTKWNTSASLMELYLSGVNFTGKIPELFSHLTSLVDLVMSSSNLSGPILNPLWNLTNIEVLDLHNNHLEGPISPFLRFGKLREFSLRNNNFDLQLEYLPFNRSWTQLETLDFSSNYLTGPIPSGVSGLQNLQSLSLSSNHLNGTIPSWIFSLPSLFDLDLSDNHFSGKIQEFKSQTLFSISVKQNQLEGPIPKSFLNQQGLYYLILSQNNLSGHIDSAICDLNLGVLNLGSCNLDGTIPQCLGEMSELWVLDLSNNSLSGTINTSFSIGNQLRVIKMDGNKLEGKVPRSLINCKYLQLFDLGNNELNDTFPKWLGALPDLQILKLRSNKLHGPINDSRTENLFAKILVIDLSSNGFSGDLPVSLFENFQAMKMIGENSGTPEYVAETYSTLYTNSLIVTTKGLDLELPQVLTTDIIIDLSMNRFEGSIPSIIGDLIGLRTLNLSHNNLIGHIPASMQHLSVLESLDLSSNKIGGEIPQQLASLTSLEVLNLSHNHLVGCIPKGKQFDTFENSSYQRNDGLRGLPLSKDCGSDEGVPQATTPFGLDQEEEEGDSSMISWQAVLMGYGCGLVIGLSVIYIMLSIRYPVWFSRMDVELEHKILTRMKKYKKGYVTSRLMIVFHQKIEETSGNHGPKLQSAILAVKKLEKQPRKPKLES
ncbi:receptor-like protein Cf-9 homolog [Solanum stenotomum]|uniref:receptor-like protein Cf-9 homolog n=1 Tax=Solanum stenotomum TaxID=172797 RepID=UPI0020D1E7D7|nr:receptor-like protein Cf-9 homolog [Solanum stenotomum]